MHVIKTYVRGADSAQDVQRMVRARAGSRLGLGERLVDEILAALEPIGATSAAPGGEIIKCVARAVADEIGFVRGLESPATTVALFFEDEASRVQNFVDHFSAVLALVLGGLPNGADEVGVLEIEVPLISLLRNAKQLVQDVVERMISRYFDGHRLDLGAAGAAIVVDRLCRHSGLTLEDAQLRPSRIKWPKDADVDGVEVVTIFLGDLPLGRLLCSLVPVRISDQARMEHCLITAGAGHGKTQTLQHMIACDLDRPVGEEVGIVVIDSQGDLISRITRLSRFARDDRLLLVDASDVEHPVSLNIFDLGGVSLTTLSRREREQAMNASVQLYEYVIGGLFGAEMTQKQSTVFRFLIRLMLEIPGATIHTLRSCLEEPKDFVHVMERLSLTGRQFFLHEFLDRQFAETRKQILRRLYGVLQNPAFERMFASSENRLDLYRALNAGRVVLCNTSQEYLQAECRVFGRYCIAVALKAAFDRARLAPTARRTSFLYVDEASDYFDESVGQLLVQARKYRLGVILAHQALDQMSDGLRALVMANTSIKLVGGSSAKDARALAPELRSSPEFVLAQEKDGASTRFATFVRNVTPSAVSWRVPFQTMERLPEMSAAQLQSLLARNRAEICSTGVDAVDADVSGGDFDAYVGRGSELSDDFSEPY